MEFKTIKASYGSYFSESPNKWHDFISLDFGEKMRQNISDYVIRAYQLTDPRLAALGTKKLSEILVSGVDSDPGHRSSWFDSIKEYFGF